MILLSDNTVIQIIDGIILLITLIVIIKDHLNNFNI